MGRPKNKYPVLLKGVNAEKEIGKLSIKKTKEPKAEGASTENGSPAEDILQEKSKGFSYFFDIQKVNNKLWNVMVDVLSNGPLPSTTNKSCWWCRNPFTKSPIGCPLKFQSPTGISLSRFLEKMKKSKLRLKSENETLEATKDGSAEFFETEGYFCSFPCCKAYILSQNKSSKFKDSNGLLTILRSILCSGPTSPISSIPSAPSWKILKEYGGHLTIEQFRATFGKLEYDETINVKHPYMFSTSQYIAERKIKLFKGVKETG